MFQSSPRPWTRSPFQSRLPLVWSTSFRLDWKQLTGLSLWRRDTTIVSCRPSCPLAELYRCRDHYCSTSSSLPCPPLSQSSSKTSLCPMPSRGLRNTIADSLPSLLRSALVLAHLVLCALFISWSRKNPNDDLLIGPCVQTKREITALPDADSPSPSPYLSGEQHDNRHGHNATRGHTDEDVMLIYTSALVRRATIARSHGRLRLSGQAVAAIALGATVVFCALLGCLLQLPIACSSLRTRLSRSGSTEPPDGSTLSTTSSAGGRASVPDLFDDDVEMMMGDQRRATRMSRLVSPPPPYSRAPSYESSENLDGRGGSTS